MMLGRWNGGYKGRQRGMWLLVVLVLWMCHQRGVVDATSTFPNPTPQGNSWGPCADATTAVATQGDGTTPGSCMSCDPTTNKCAPKCQPLLDTFYRACDGVYTPPDLAFDPAKNISGFWGDVQVQVRISVQRCGCNKASPVQTTLVTMAVVGLVVVVAGMEWI